MTRRDQLIADLTDRLEGHSERALEALLYAERRLCPTCGSRTTTRSSSAVGTGRQVYLKCSCGWKGTRVLYPHNGSSGGGRAPGGKMDVTARTPSRKGKAMAITTSEFSKRKAKLLEAALCLTACLENPESHFDTQTLELAHDQYEGLSLRALMAEVAAERGEPHGDREFEANFRSAFGPASPGNILAKYSTIDIGGILSNVANKFLLAGFNAVESGWRNIAAIGTVNDFKERTSFALTGDMKYEKVGAAGELAHATLGEEEYTSQAETYGKILAVGRMDIINDDLGALTTGALKLGRGAGLALNAVFWREFLADAGTFYTAGRGNLQTGAGSALASAGLKAATTAFKKQTDPDGEPLGITPRTLVVPPELEITASELMTSTAINTGGAAADAQVPNKNVWSGKYEIVAPSYLSNANYPGASATGWYLVAHPLDLAVIEVVFLNGRQTPTVDEAKAHHAHLAFSVRAYHDFGVSKVDYRASVRSAGA